eukprot:s434_g19.t1
MLGTDDEAVQAELERRQARKAQADRAATEGRKKKEKDKDSKDKDNDDDDENTTNVEVELPSVRSSSVGGSGARAARSLRADASDSRLPQVDSPPKGPSGMKPRKEKITTHAGPEMLDETKPPESFDVRHRLDASRSAMMLRLLRQVPQETLAQELKDMGVAVEALDKEGLVQAMVQQLS